MSDIAIRAVDLGKMYRIGGPQERYSTLRDTITNAFTAPISKVRGLLYGESASGLKQEIWALKDISFEVKRGEIIGIIGPNGAGKSTLLKILSQITEPTKGHVDIYGRVGALLEVGTGFHPELTGRENVFLNGAILGMTRKDIERKFDEIVDFAGVEKFIDTPVKHYSSGMILRLGFAVAAHLEPDILIVDEVLAVGDLRFQQKCIGKISDIVNQDRTVLFVSHDMGAVNSLTRQCMLLENGSISKIGATPQIIHDYLKVAFDYRKIDNARINLAQYRRKRLTSPMLEIESIWLDDHQYIPTLELGQDFSLYISIKAFTDVYGVNITVTIRNNNGQNIALIFSLDHSFTVDLVPGIQVIELKMRSSPLSPGEYYVDIGLNQSVSSVAFDVVQNVPLCSIVNTYQILEWPNRPWGIMHWTDVQWNQATNQLNIVDATKS